MKKFLLLPIFGLGLAMFAIFHDRFGLAVKAAGGAVALVCFVLLLFIILYARERLLMFRAERIEAMKRAHVEVVSNNGQVYIRDTDKNATWRAAHLDPRRYTNGKAGDPTPAEIAAWQAFHGPKRAVAQKSDLLPQSTTQIDLLAASDSVQRCLVVGASDSGKTTLLQWLVSRRLNTSRVIVIDPHAYPGKWPDSADLVGSGRDYPAIDRALTALVQLMGKRYDEIGRGLVAEMAHGRVTVLIDEWRAIVYALGKPASEAITSLLVESRKAAFSVFVATHSDRAKPLGLEGEYDLKDGFAVVRLSVVDGRRQATIDYGNGEVPAVLPGPFQGKTPQILDHQAGIEPALSPTDEPLDLEPEPSTLEGFVLEMHERGETVSAIAQQVYGHKGGHQNKQIKEILVKFGQV